MTLAANPLPGPMRTMDRYLPPSFRQRMRLKIQNKIYLQRLTIKRKQLLNW
jgi:hypothetical protein